MIDGGQKNWKGSRVDGRGVKWWVSCLPLGVKITHPQTGSGVR